MKRPIIIVPDPILRVTAQMIERITPDIKTLADDMIETMYDAPGIGLAANQVNIAQRIIVMDVHYREDHATRNPIIMINPEIIWESEEQSEWEEGCLSIPQQYATVSRPKSVRVKYQDLQCQTNERVVEDLESHCVQHEIDHLNGVLFIDYLSRLKRDMILRRVEKLQRDVTVM